MRIRVTSLLLALCCALAAVPARADSIYDNGPANGLVDAWTINSGFAVSDTFTLVDKASPKLLMFSAWLLPGDILSSVEVSIGSQAFGNELFDETVSLTQSDCASNEFGYSVCQENGVLTPPGPPLRGTFWMTLSNADTSNGDPVYWDENSGVGCMSSGCPSLAQENTVGTIPSEAFTLIAGNTSTTGTTPEPGSIFLCGTGVLGFAGLLRRKLSSRRART